MVVVPFWEHTQSHNVLFLFLSLYPHEERKPKGNQGALQEVDYCVYRSALILSLWRYGQFRYVFIYYLQHDYQYGYEILFMSLWLIIRINIMIYIMFMYMNVRLCA